MKTLQSLLYVWQGMLSGLESGHKDGDAIIASKIYPEGNIYLASHNSSMGSAFRGGPRLRLEHAEHDLSVHIYKCIVAQIDLARQTLKSEHPSERLGAKWVLAVYEHYELFLDTMELELSRISATIPEW